MFVSLGPVLCVVLAAAEPPAPDAAVWRDVDIVPMPKRIGLTGRTRPVAGLAIVVGRAPSVQARIGADWINRRLAELGGEPLPIVSADRAPEAAIVVGVPADNPLIAGAGLHVGPGAPGERGYAIGMTDRRVLLAGADPLGALYACVTFAELLIRDADGRVAWREARVRDWPDFLHCPLSGTRAGATLIPELHGILAKVRRAKPSAKRRDQYLAAVKAHYDRLLRWKVSYLQYQLPYKWSRKMAPESQALIREGVEYGKQRGIGALIYAEQPFVCLTAEHPEVKRSCLPAGRYKEYIRCWSMDEVRRKHAARLAAMVKALGLTDIGFHDTDTGGFENPARWNERCERCRKRWGDDYVAATVHKHRIYYDALKRAVPDLRVHFTIYPYNINVLDHEASVAYLTGKYGGGPSVVERARVLKAKMEVFWKRIAREMPADVSFCIRETLPGAVRRFRELTKPHPVFTWYGLPGKVWRPYLCEPPRWVGTFYGGPGDFLFPQPFGELFVPLQGLAVREYAWNTRAPGAAGWRGGRWASWQRDDAPAGAIFTTVYPHVIRNLFGRQAAPHITRALLPNMDPHQIWQRYLRGPSSSVLKDAKSMASQAAKAEVGAKALDAVWAKCEATRSRLGMTDFAFRRFVYLREAFHACLWMARARTANLEARERARAQDAPGAEAAVKRGLEAVAQSKADFEQLVRQRPDDPVLMTKGYNRYADGWRAFMPGWDADFSGVEKRLRQTRKELAELGSLGAVPERITDLLVKRRTVRALEAAGPVAIDGRAAEPDWRGAYPVECFFVYKKGTQIARAHTRVRLLYDKANLYAAFTCWAPAGVRPQAQERAPDESVLADDSVELFLFPPDLAGDYVHLMANAAGAVRTQRGRLEMRDGVKSWRQDNAWTCPGLVAKAAVDDGSWTLEMKVPLASLGVKARRGGWRVNLCRNCPLPGGEREHSSTQPPDARDFHDVKRFRSLVWLRRQPYQAHATIEVAGLETQVRTFSDRIATVAAFRVEALASQVLTDVELRAEAYAADGSLQARKTLLRCDRLFYAWRPTELCEVAFEQQCKAGGVRLTLASAEGSWQRWVRFGGWAGHGKVGGVFAPGSTDAPVSDFRHTPSLAGQAYFGGAVKVEGRADVVRLFGSRAGTIEFWLRPTWPLPPLGKSEHRQGRHAILHFGVMRRRHPRNTNCSSVSLVHHAANNSLQLQVTSRGYVSWTSTVSLSKPHPWRPGAWRHVACVWDASAPRRDWLRLYVDGNRVAGLASVGHEDRLGDDKSVRVEADSPFVVQLGGLNTGRCPAEASVDELRLSRTARYTADFTPPARELALDKHTTALFHFNDSLEGAGLTPDGRPYKVRAIAGVLEYH